MGTAVIANRARLDGLEVIVQQPDRHAEELAYLQETVQARYAQLEEARGRLLELLHHRLHHVGDKKRTEIALDSVTQLEAEGHVPQAHYAFDHGVVSLELSRVMERAGKHWVSELACSRHLQWQGQWRRVDAVAAELRGEPPASFRPVRVRCRNGETKVWWAFPKVVRLTRYGRQRLVIVHEQEDLRDAPRFLLSDARHWESGRMIEMWRYRWTSEIFHEFAKQVCGLEAAQVRQAEAVKRHCRCLRQTPRMHDNQSAGCGNAGFPSRRTRFPTTYLGYGAGRPIGFIQHQRLDNLQPRWPAGRPGLRDLPPP